MLYEILSPVGKLADLQLIINAGADAVYMGLKGFSSRPQSADLSVDELRQAFIICRKNGVKLYVAINSCIHQNMLDTLIAQIRELDEIGVDSVILADWGLIHYFSDKLKHAQIHASTLLGVFNIDTVLELKRMKVTRIILSTNLYMDEIVKIIHAVPDLEYEIVADGGNCFNDNFRCELPHSASGMDYKVFCKCHYDLVENKNKSVANSIAGDLINMDEVIALYMAVGINSYKIEGRTMHGSIVANRTQKLKAGLLRAQQSKNEQDSYLHYFLRIKNPKRR